MNVIPSNEVGGRERALSAPEMLGPLMGLPDFDNPPVREVALSVQFSPVLGAGNMHFGQLWADVFRERFPETEEHPPLPAVTEDFGFPGAGRVQVQLVVGPPVSRYWFKNAEGTELLQVQRDRFTRNWRQLRTGKPYPRYETLRGRFAEDYRLFIDFIGAQKLGSVVPNQCEVTYVNDMDHGEGWDTFADTDKVVTVWKSEFSDDFLPRPEQLRFAVSFPMPGPDGRPLGRLHISLEPRYRMPERERLLRLSLTSRGAPIGDGLEGVLAFMDLGREWVVKGFASITRPEMHELWRRKGDR